jgi:nucleoside-diphosphate-sugar epimerase
MKKILITGGAGYVGSVLIRKLLDKHYHVRILDQLVFGKEPVQDLLFHKNFDLIIGNIEDEYIIQKAVQDVDAVIHLAGISNDPCCELAPELTHKVNYLGTKQLLKLAKEAGVKRFIFASTASVYGASEDNTITEQSQTNPISLYAKTKLESEKLVSEAQTDNFSTCSLRKSTVYGYSPRMRFDLVVNIMTAMAIKERKIVINGGNQWRPHLHISDAANAYITCLEAPEDKIRGQIFNVGSENFRITDVGNLVKEIFPDIKVFESDTPDKRSYQSSFDKIKTILNFKPEKTIREGILEIKEAFDKELITNYMDLNYYNIKRVMKLGFDIPFNNKSYK